MEVIMKKFLAIILACLVLCSVLVACGGDEKESADIVVGDFEEGSDEYYVPEPDGGTSNNKDFELGEVPLS